MSRSSAQNLVIQHLFHNRIGLMLQTVACTDMRSSYATQNQFVTNKQHSCMYSPATISAMLLSPTVLFSRHDKLLNQEAHLARVFLSSSSSGKSSLSKGLCGCLVTYEKTALHNHIGDLYTTSIRFKTSVFNHGFR